MKKKYYLLAIGLALIMVFNLYLGEIKNKVEIDLKQLKTAYAYSTYTKPLGQYQDGRYCCVNTNEVSCPASILCE